MNEYTDGRYAGQSDIAKKAEEAILQSDVRIHRVKIEKKKWEDNNDRKMGEMKKELQELVVSIQLFLNSESDLLKKPITHEGALMEFQRLYKAILLLMEAMERTKTIGSDYKRVKHELEFKECSICAAKPGSPQLCGSCYSNRWVINRLTSLMEAMEGEGV